MQTGSDFERAKTWRNALVERPTSFESTRVEEGLSLLVLCMCVLTLFIKDTWTIELSGRSPSLRVEVWSKSEDMIGWFEIDCTNWTLEQELSLNASVGVSGSPMNVSVKVDSCVFEVLLPKLDGLKKIDFVARTASLLL